MWKKAVLRIWMENKGVDLCVKAFLFFLLIFGGIFAGLYGGFPNGILLILFVSFMEIKMEVPVSYMEDLLPRAKEERKKLDVWESTLISGIYTFAYALGNVSFFVFSERNLWNEEAVFYQVKTAVFVFLVLFAMRVWYIWSVMEGINRPAFVLEEKERDRAEFSLWSVWGNVYCFYGSLFYLLLYSIGKFAGVKKLSFIAFGRFHTAPVLDGIFFVLLWVQTVKICRGKVRQ